MRKAKNFKSFPLALLCFCYFSNNGPTVQSSSEDWGKVSSSVIATISRCVCVEISRLLQIHGKVSSEFRDKTIETGNSLLKLWNLKSEKVDDLQLQFRFTRMMESWTLLRNFTKTLTRSFVSIKAAEGMFVASVEVHRAIELSFAGQSRLFQLFLSLLSRKWRIEPSKRK